MILKENFYADPGANPLTRGMLGLQPGTPTALIMFGGNGSSSATKTILNQLENTREPVQTIVLCGNNKKLVKDLSGRPDCHATGFVSNVADYMRLSDFVIGKPGPGSISEAVFCGCPVIVEGNSSTMPQERPNLDWIKDNGVGIVVESFRKEMTQAADVLISHLQTYRENIIRNIPPNRAIFEVIDILGHKMQQGRS